MVVPTSLGRFPIGEVTFPAAVSADGNVLLSIAVVHVLPEHLHAVRLHAFMMPSGYGTLRMRRVRPPGSHGCAISTEVFACADVLGPMPPHVCPVTTTVKVPGVW